MSYKTKLLITSRILTENLNKYKKWTFGERPVFL